jgi:hypothetical protein
MALSQQQKNRFEVIRRNRGAEVASQYKAKVGTSSVSARPRTMTTSVPKFNVNNPRSVVRGQQGLIDKTVPQTTPNINNWMGDRSVTYDSSGRPQVTESLSGGQQSLYDGQINARNNINNVAGSYITQAQGQGAFNPSYSDPRSGQRALPSFQDPRQGTGNIPQLMNTYRDPRQGIGSIPNFNPQIQDARKGTGNVQNFSSNFQDPRDNLKFNLPSDFSAERDKIYKDTLGVYQRATDDERKLQFEQLNQQLINSGHSPGSPQYDRQIGNFNKTWAEKTADVSARAYRDAGQEQSRMFSDSLAGRGQEFNENFSSGDQRYNQGIGQAGFNNQAQNQRFNQNLGAFGQQFDQGLATANYGLNAQNQGFTQNFNTNAQEYGLDLDRARYGMDAQNQRYNQNYGANEQQFNQAYQGNQQAFSQNFDTNTQRYGQQYQNYMTPHNVAGQYLPYYGQFDAPNFGSVQQINRPVADLAGTAGNYFAQLEASRRQREGNSASAGVAGSNNAAAMARLREQARLERENMGYGYGLQGGLYL